MVKVCLTVFSTIKLLFLWVCFGAGVWIWLQGYKENSRQMLSNRTLWHDGAFKHSKCGSYKWSNLRGIIWIWKIPENILYYHIPNVFFFFKYIPRFLKMLEEKKTSIVKEIRNHSRERTLWNSTICCCLRIYTFLFVLFGLVLGVGETVS